MYCTRDTKVSALDVDFHRKFCFADMHYQSPETRTIPLRLPPQPKHQLLLLLPSSTSKEVKREQQRMMAPKVIAKQKST